MLCQTMFRELPVAQTTEAQFIYSCKNGIEQLDLVKNGALVFKHLFNGKDWLTELADGTLSHQSLTTLSQYRYMRGFGNFPHCDDFDRIEKAETLVREVRNREKKIKAAKKVADYFSDLAPITDDHMRFLREDILPNYIFYSREDNEAYCSACHSDFSPKLIGKTRQGLVTVCPICGKKATLKSKGRGHNIADGGTGLIVQAFRGGLVMRYFDIYKKYSADYRDPQYKIREVVREVFDSNMQSSFYEDCDARGWHKCNIKVTNEGPDYVVRYSPYYMCGIYSTDFSDTLKGTAYEFCHFEYFTDIILPSYGDKWQSRSPWRWRWWFNQMTTYGNLFEYLFKVGLNKIALHYWHHGVNGSYYASSIKLRFNPDGKRLNDMLRITKPQLKQLIALGDPEPYILCCLQHDIDLLNEPSMYDELSKHISSAGEIGMYAKLFKFSVHRFIKYVRRKDDHITESNYLDYLDMLDKLHRDLHNDFLVFPKHFHEAHQDAVAEWNRVKSEEKRALAIKEGIAYAKRVEELIKQWSFNSNGLQIVVPKNCGEIVDEGVALHHCVGTYTDKVRKGETLILFIRKSDDMEKPFYTMEVRSGHIQQCYGFSNCHMTAEVKKFVDDFRKAKAIA